MPLIFFTPASIGYLTQLILAFAITVFLVLRLRGKDARLLLLICFFVSITVFIGLLFLDAALLPFQRLLAVYAENTILALSIVFLLQFAYHFPRAFVQRKWETRASLVFSLGYLLWEAQYMVQRYVALLDTDTVNYRPLNPDYALALVLLWVPIAFLRQCLAADPRPVNWLRKLWKPEGMEARSARAFLFVFAFLFLLSLINIWRATSAVSTTFYNISLSIGILVTLWQFAVSYINFVPGGVSVQAKLSILTLTLFLALLGSVGWLVAPTFIATFEPNLTSHQTLRFFPNASGGYDVDVVDFNFENTLGEKVPVSYREERRNYKINFTFPFYGETYTELYVTSSGVVGLGEPFYQPNLQAASSSTPAIIPLMIELDPESVSDGGVYVLQEPDRLVLTWSQVPALYKQGAVFTFQTVLFADGIFEITYDSLPLPFIFDPDTTPSANPWKRGAISGSGVPLHINTDDLLTTARAGRSPLLEDYHLAFRRYLHTLMLPLALVVIGGSLVLLLVLPILLRHSIVRPLDALIAGVQRMDVGDLTANIPVQSDDEIGYLTNTFNKMASRLGGLVSGLETRVAERTQALESANQNLQSEIREREAAQEKLMQQQRTLAVMDERERFGRDLHDGIGQTMGYINVEAQAAHAFLKDGQIAAAQASLDGISHLAQAAHDNIRKFILGLRSSEVAENLFVTLEMYLHQFSENTGIQATLSIPSEETTPFFASPVEEQILYIVREALTNVHKHASARQVEVLFNFTDSHVHIIVSDDGIGFNLAQPNGDEAGIHFGLGVMKERARLVGGNLEVRTVLGKGTKVLVNIPRRPFVQSKIAESELASARELRILLVDDSPLFLDGLRNMLMARGLVVVGIARNGYDAHEKARALRPDVIVMDIDMPGCNGIEATRVIKAELPEIMIVILTVSEDDENIFQAIRSGASGYLLKSLDADEFCKLLAGLARGESPLTPGLATRLLTDLTRLDDGHPRIASRQSDKELTPRQWQILELVAQGLQYKEVAEALSLNEQTVKYHMGRVLEQLHLENRQQAIAYARRHQRENQERGS